MFRQSQIEEAKQEMDLLWRYHTPKRVPIGSMWFSESFSICNAGKNIAKIFHQPEAIYNAVCWTASQYRWNPFVQFSGMSVLGCFDFGGTMRYPQKEGEVFGPLRYPVSCEEDVDKLVLPDLQTAGDISRQLEFAQLQKKIGFPVTFFSRSPFCMAADMCGVNLFMEWLLEKPELCRRLIDHALQHILNALDHWVATFGAENLQVWMSTPTESNQLISPKHLETFALPYHLAYHDHLKNIGIRQFCIHLCSDQNRNLPLLAEADPWDHPAILSFGSEVEITRAAEMFPHDIIYGNLDTTLLQAGSPAAVFDTCREILEKGRRIEAGFVLAPGCEPPAFTPPVNVYAMTMAVDEHGAY